MRTEFPSFQSLNCGIVEDLVSCAGFNRNRTYLARLVRHSNVKKAFAGKMMEASVWWILWLRMGDNNTGALSLLESLGKISLRWPR